MQPNERLLDIGDPRCRGAGGDCRLKFRGGQGGTQRLRGGGSDGQRFLYPEDED